MGLWPAPFTSKLAGAAIAQEEEADIFKQKHQLWQWQQPLLLLPVQVRLQKQLLC